MSHIPTPLIIKYNTDVFFDPDEEDLQDRYVVGIEDADGDTVLYTDSGYFKISEERAQYFIKAINSHQAMKEALEKAVYELNAIRARDGAPQHIEWYQGRPLQNSSCTEEYWNALTEECYAALTLAK